MRNRLTLAIAVALIVLPAAVAALEGARYYLSNRSTHTLISSGLTREYILHVPASYDSSRPAPLVISMHGAAMWPAAQRDTSQWDRVAEREGFLAAYPSALVGRGPRIWEAVAGGDVQRDATFIGDLIDEIGRTYNIDGSRIYANGLSNGGGMAFALSCTMPERIAAIGVVSSAQLLPWDSCEQAPPVPMVAFHGTADTATPYQGARSWVTPRGGRPFPDIEEWVATFAKRNGCAPSALRSAVASDVTRIAYPDCPKAPVVLYRIEGGGHTWPGGGYLPEWFVGPNTHSIDASALMWEFYKAQPLQK